MTAPTLSIEAAGERTWDAVVVGAGPAGGLAARQLAAGGADVLLVEKKAVPRLKVCGACLNGRALGVLGSVGLEGLVERGGGIDLKEWQICFHGRLARFPLPRGKALGRDRLDSAVVEAAIAAGARFLPETQAIVEAVREPTRPVRLDQRGRATRVEARVVLVAAGLGNTCLEHVEGATTDVAPRSRIGAGCVVFDFPPCYREGTIYMAVAREGYLGLVRVQNGGLNVAASFERAILKRWSEPSRAANAVLAEAGLSPISSLEGADWHGTVALTRTTRPIAAHRLFLLGDAAGYVEPITGEGMAWALASAQAVAPLALRGIAAWEPSLEREWTALQARLVGRRQRLCRGLALVLHHPWVARAIFELAKRAPAVPRMLLARVNAPVAAPAPAVFFKTS
jgi:flavin-dependent dehydrogenase